MCYAPLLRGAGFHTKYGRLRGVIMYFTHYISMSQQGLLQGTLR
jgi:hypothetical protein